MTWPYVIADLATDDIKLEGDLRQLALDLHNKMPQADSPLDLTFRALLLAYNIGHNDALNSELQARIDAKNSLSWERTRLEAAYEHAAMDAELAEHHETDRNMQFLMLLQAMKQLIEAARASEHLRKAEEALVEGYEDADEFKTRANAALDAIDGLEDENTQAARAAAFESYIRAHAVDTGRSRHDVPNYTNGPGTDPADE